jgi:hypothetical protein
MLVLTGPFLPCSNLKKFNIQPGIADTADTLGASSATCAGGTVTARSPSTNTVDNAKHLTINDLAMMATAHDTLETVEASYIRCIEHTVSTSSTNNKLY